MIVQDAALTHILTHRPTPAHKLRITINAGGCSGFSKQFTWCDHMDASDVSAHECVVTDSASWELIQNAQLTYVTHLQGSGWQLQIPEATSNCGCGVSFQI